MLVLFVASKMAIRSRWSWYDALECFEFTLRLEESEVCFLSPTMSDSSSPSIHRSISRKANSATCSLRAEASLLSAAKKLAWHAPPHACRRYRPTLKILHRLPCHSKKFRSFRATNDFPRAGKPTNTMTSRVEFFVNRLLCWSIVLGRQRSAECKQKKASTWLWSIEFINFAFYNFGEKLTASKRFTTKEVSVDTSTLPEL